MPQDYYILKTLNMEDENIHLLNKIQSSRIFKFGK